MTDAERQSLQCDKKDRKHKFVLPIFFASRFSVACIFPAVSRCGGMLQREHRAQHLRPSHKSYGVVGSLPVMIIFYMLRLVVAMVTGWIAYPIALIKAVAHLRVPNDSEAAE